MCLAPTRKFPEVTIADVLHNFVDVDHRETECPQNGAYVHKPHARAAIDECRYPRAGHRADGAAVACITANVHNSNQHVGDCNITGKAIEVPYHLVVSPGDEL